MHRTFLLLMLSTLAMAASLVDRIATNEGLRLSRYLDSRGVPSIGYGHNTSNEPWQTMTPMQAEYMLALDIAKAQAACANLPGYSQASLATQSVVTEAFFVLGTVGAMHFQLFLKALSNNDPKGMARELLNSKWHGQATHRVERLCLILIQQP